MRDCYIDLGGISPETLLKYLEYLEKQNVLWLSRDKPTKLYSMCLNSNMTYLLIEDNLLSHGYEHGTLPRFLNRLEKLKRIL